MHHSNKVIKYPKGRAYTFNDFFIKISSKLNPQIVPSTTFPFQFIKPTNPNCFYAFLTGNCKTCQEILFLNNESNSRHKIPLFIYKICANIISHLVTYLFNESILSVTFPHSLKLTRITPIFKSY